LIEQENLIVAGPTSRPIPLSVIRTMPLMSIAPATVSCAAACGDAAAAAGAGAGVVVVVSAIKWAYSSSVRMPFSCRRSSNCCVALSWASAGALTPPMKNADAAAWSRKRDFIAFPLMLFSHADPCRRGDAAPVRGLPELDFGSRSLI
jgi:hypothetical protein